MASVLLNDAPNSPIDFAGAVERARRAVGRQVDIGVVDTRNDGDARANSGETPGEIAFVPVGKGRLILALMRVPVPSSELKQTCLYVALWFEQGCEVAAAHRAHVLVRLGETGLEPVDEALVMTRVLGALIDTLGTSRATAVYWGTTLSSSSEFTKWAGETSADNLPVHAWISYRVSIDPASKRPSISTSGMTQFGLMEFEVVDGRRDAAQALPMLMDLSLYVLKSGPIIADGDTIGQTASEKIRVRHRESNWNNGQRVYRVEM